MHFDEMVTEIINFRFNQTLDIYVKRWLNLREMQVWAATEWPWKKLTNVTLTIDTGDDALDLPTAVRRVVNVYDEAGSALTWIPPDEFASRNRGNTVGGHPSEYTLSSNQIILAPAARAYNSRSTTTGVFHYDISGTKTNGVAVTAAPGLG
jgi:hypothetical protein